MLERILTAAHAAPSVGHSQPWRFVVVRDPATRDRAALMADRAWHQQAGTLADSSGRQMLDLQLHGIREAPVGIVVCCDRRTAAQGVLGRATYVDADLWSCACAIENLWLAARVEGVGTGWVTLFQPDELRLAHRSARRCGDDGLALPRLARRAAARARAGTCRLVGAPAALGCRAVGALAENGPPPPSRLQAPAPESVVGARDEADLLLTPPGSLGALDRAVDRLAALGVAADAPVTSVVAAAAHPVTRHGVSTYDDAVTREVLEATVAGESLGAVAARLVGADVIAVDAGVPGGPVAGAVVCRPAAPPGDLVSADALSAEDAERLVAAGRVLGLGLSRRLVALGEVGIGNTTVASALVASRLGLAVADAVGLGAGGDSATIARKRDAVGAALERAASAHADLDDPLVLLAALGGAEIAYLTGVLLGAAEVGSVIVLDGLVTSAAALRGRAGAGGRGPPRGRPGEPGAGAPVRQRAPRPRAAARTAPALGGGRRCAAGGSAPADGRRAPRPDGKGCRALDIGSEQLVMINELVDIVEVTLTRNDNVSAPQGVRDATVTTL